MEREGREGKRESESEREDRWNGNKIIPIIIREEKKKGAKRGTTRIQNKTWIFSSISRYYYLF